MKIPSHGPQTERKRSGSYLADWLLSNLLALVSTESHVKRTAELATDCNRHAPSELQMKKKGQKI